jgi:alkanesulfonate monooxygenase
MTSSPTFDWYVPTGADSDQLIKAGGSRHLAASIRPNRSGIDYLRHVACVAEEAGYDGVMLPTGVATEDGGLLAAVLAQDTRQLRLMVSFRGGPELPTHFAQRIATLQLLAGQRVEVCLFNGSDSEQRSYGDFIAHDDAYERAGEFLDIAKALWRGEPVQHASRYYIVDCHGRTEPAAAVQTVTDSGFPAALGYVPLVHVFGASAAAGKIVSQHADVHMMWGEPPALLEERITQTRLLAQRAGREIRLGLRIGIIARETEEEGWEEATQLLEAVPANIIDHAQQEMSRWSSVGLARMQRLHDHGRVRAARALEIYPNLWAGSCLVGSTTTLVGSYEQVRERIGEFIDLGFSTFVLSGYPNLETMQRVARFVLPALRVN